MRTTLTLDEDVAHRLTERSRLTGASFKQVVNETLRAGLEGAAAVFVAAREWRVVAGMVLSALGPKAAGRKHSPMKAMNAPIAISQVPIFVTMLVSPGVSDLRAENSYTHS